MVTKKENTETENKYELFQKAYADANALVSRQLISTIFWRKEKKICPEYWFFSPYLLQVLCS